MRERAREEKGSGKSEERKKREREREKKAERAHAQARLKSPTPRVSPYADVWMFQTGPGPRRNLTPMALPRPPSLPSTQPGPLGSFVHSFALASSRPKLNHNRIMRPDNRARSRRAYTARSCL